MQTQRGAGMTISGVHRHDNGALHDDHDVLDAEDVAAELLGDADEPPTTAMPRRGLNQRRASPPHARPPAARLQPSAASSARLAEAEAELTRLRRHMRARDAYLAELEQALLASTTKLKASGISSVEDAHKLFGRLRGQAFRIAELESELRSMEQRLSRLTRLLPGD